MSQTADKQTDTEQNAPAEKAGGESFLQRASLKIAGVLYAIGDLSLFVAGRMKGKSARQEAATGATWFLGGVAAAIFGNEKSERKLRRVRREFSQYFQTQGLEIPDDSILSAKKIASESSRLDRAGDFLYTHPSQLLNGSYAVGAVMLAKSGFDARKDPNGPGKINLGSVGSGILIETGAIGGLLIPEHKKHDAKKPDGFFGRIKSWVCEKPLRFPAIAYWLNEGTLIWKGLQDKRDHPGSKSYLFTFGTVVSYLMANGLLLITHKNEANKKTPLDITSLEEAAASIVAMQVPEKQQKLVAELAGYLAARPEISRKTEEVADGINLQLTKKLYKALDQIPTEETSRHPTAWQDRTRGTGLQPIMGV